MDNCVITFKLFTPKKDKDVTFIGEVEIMAVSYSLISRINAYSGFSN